MVFFLLYSSHYGRKKRNIADCCTAISCLKLGFLEPTFRTCSIVLHKHFQEHVMKNPNANNEAPALVNEGIVEAFTAATVAISGFLALLIFAA